MSLTFKWFFLIVFKFSKTLCLTIFLLHTFVLIFCNFLRFFIIYFFIYELEVFFQLNYPITFHRIILLCFLNILY